MAKLTPAQKRVESILPPLVRRLRRRRKAREAQAVKFKDKRKRPRSTIEELNAGGINALKAKGMLEEKEK